MHVRQLPSDGSFQLRDTTPDTALCRAHRAPARHGTGWGTEESWPQADTPACGVYMRHARSEANTATSPDPSVSGRAAQLNQRFGTTTVSNCSDDPSREIVHPAPVIRSRNARYRSPYTGSDRQFCRCCPGSASPWRAASSSEGPRPCRDPEGHQHPVPVRGQRREQQLEHLIRDRPQRLLRHRAAVTPSCTHSHGSTGSEGRGNARRAAAGPAGTGRSSARCPLPAGSRRTSAAPSAVVDHPRRIPVPGDGLPITGLTWHLSR